MTPKVDLRVIKTKRGIHTAFIQLLNEKGFQSMTVQDILDAALINRKTFYKYYADKYDLAEQTAKSFLGRFDTILETRFLDDDNSRQALNTVERIYEELYKDKQEIHAIWKIRTDKIDVMSEIGKRLQGVYLKLSDMYVIQGDVQFQAQMFSSFVMTSYEYIMETEKPYEAHKLLNEFQNLYEAIAKATQ